MPIAAKRIREYLKAVDGATLPEIISATGIDQNTVRAAIPKMADVYVDRWCPHLTGKGWVRVFALADIPEDCPKPEDTPAAQRDSVFDLLQEMQPCTANELADVIGCTGKRIDGILRSSTKAHIVGKRGGTRGSFSNLWGLR